MRAISKRNSRNGYDVQARLNSLRADLDTLRDDMRGLVNDVGAATSHQFHGALNDAGESALHTVERMETWSNENLDGMRKRVQRQPLAACALAMGAGVLLGKIFLRR